MHFKANDITTEQIQEAVERLGSMRKAAAEIGMSRSGIQDRLKKVGGCTPPQKPKGSKPAGRSLDEFRAKYDKDYIVPSRIREQLAAIGPDCWLYESEMVAEMPGVNYNDLANYRDMFSEHIVWVRRESKRAWAGSAKLAEQLRAML